MSRQRARGAGSRSSSRRIVRVARTPTGDGPTDADRSGEPADHVDLTNVLATGEIVACKELPWGSNYSFAVIVRVPDGSIDGSIGGRAVTAIYKPRRGEAPLWDFPAGTLYRREYASYLLTRSLGWGFIPLTVVREGPYGTGTIQLYVDPDEEADFELLRREHRADLQRIALFDLIANNADRKISHLIRDRAGHLWGIDHGLTFHVVPKLRTAIWDFCGEPIPPPLRLELDGLHRDPARVAELRQTLGEHLEMEELDALLDRVAQAVESGVYPPLDPYRNYPRGWW
ncbi:MAG: SCO1664 family protein [Chloroflexi bacterium]|nr:SCO1664 family protein [Chloroflexota bacterium]